MRNKEFHEFSNHLFIQELQELQTKNNNYNSFNNIMPQNNNINNNIPNPK